MVRSSWARLGVAGFGPAMLDVEWLGSLEMGGVGCGMARLGADRYWLGSLRRVGVLAVLGVGCVRFSSAGQAKVCLSMVRTGSVSMGKVC